MSKQHCRSNSVACSFHIVGIFGNKVERWFDIVAKNGNKIEATFDFVEATFDFVAFDNVAGVDGVEEAS